MTQSEELNIPSGCFYYYTYGGHDWYFDPKMLPQVYVTIEYLNKENN